MDRPMFNYVGLLQSGEKESMPRKFSVAFSSPYAVSTYILDDFIKVVNNLLEQYHLPPIVSCKHIDDTPIVHTWAWDEYKVNVRFEGKNTPHKGIVQFISLDQLGVGK